MWCLILKICSLPMFFSSIYNSKLNRLLKLSFHNKGRLSMNLSKILLMVSKSSQKTPKLPSWTSAKESCRKLLLRKLWIVKCFHTPSPISDDIDLTSGYVIFNSYHLLLWYFAKKIYDDIYWQNIPSYHGITGSQEQDTRSLLLLER